MATRITILFLLLATVAGAQITTDTKDVQVARQKLQVGTDNNKWVSSIVEVITAAATHRQSPTAKAVYDYVSDIDSARLAYVDSLFATVGGQIDTFYRSNDTIYLKLVDDTIRFVTLPVSTTHLTFTGATSPIILNSSTGTDVSFKDSTGIAIKQVGGFMTILNTGDTNGSDDLTGSGAVNQFAILTGANTFTGNAAFTYRILHRALELGASSVNGNNKTRFHIGGADTVVNAVSARFFSMHIGNSIRTSNTNQTIGWLGTTAASISNPVFFVDHNNTTVRPIRIEAPTITIAGGVTGTNTSSLVAFLGSPSFSYAFTASAQGSGRAIYAENSTNIAIETYHTPNSLTSQPGILMEITPSINGNVKRGLYINNNRNSANGNGVGIDFGLRTSTNNVANAYMSNFVVDNTNATFTSAFIFEPYTNGTRSEHLRISNNAISVNTAAQPTATIDAKSQGSTSSHFIMKLNNSGGSSNNLVVRADGFTGMGEGTPTSTLHINGANGYNQLRLNDSYTPTSTADSNGAVGDVAWDADYIYIKTAAGWKRTALSTF